MAIITVNTSTDEADGSIFDGDISLRDALAVAVDGDVITFDNLFFSSNSSPLNNATIMLTLGQLAITSGVTIDGDLNGDGIADVTIDGNGLSRIFEVTGGANVTINGMTLQNGATTGSGGAIAVGFAGNTLNVSNSNFVDNEADDGGAIATVGTLAVANTFFLGNGATFDGGAVSAYGDSTFINATFTENYANAGGAVFVGNSASVDLINSTLTGNLANIAGGGVGGAGDLNVSNSIVYGNKALGSDNDIATPLDSNGANIFGTGVTGVGGDQSLSILDLPNVFDAFGPVMVDGTTFDAGMLSQVTGINPIIGIAEGGLAQDAGDNSDVLSESDLGFDVDGDGTVEIDPMERDSSGYNRVAGSSVDIGASESFNRTWIVDTTDDVVDGDLTTGNLSLREAVENARDGDTITFDETIFTADDDERVNTTIALTQGTSLSIHDSNEISIIGDVNGDGIADVTLDGAGNVNRRMIYTAVGTTLNVEGLTFANGYTSYVSGAAIGARGDLNVLNSTFTNNTSGVFGGAIRVYNGTATIANSTFDRNQAEKGGAIRSTADTTIFNSTFYGNHATSDSFDEGGGAIESGGSGSSLEIINSTITGNSAVEGGGGLRVSDGAINIENSIIVGNTGLYMYGGGEQSDFHSTVGVTTNSGNVFGVTNLYGGGDLTNRYVGDVFDTLVTNSVGGLTVLSGALGNNGGATDTVLILQGGDAADQGSSPDIPTEAELGLDVDGDGTIAATAVDVDQRGGVRGSGEQVDAGAVELDNDLVLVTTTEDTIDGDLSADDISWREAISLVNEGGTIAFDPSVFIVNNDPLNNVQIDMTEGTEHIIKSLTINGDINGDGIADVTIDGTGNGNARALAVSAMAPVSLIGLTFTNHYSNDSGAVIRVASSLLVRDSNFIDNASTIYGGAIRNYAAGMVIENSYFGGNSSDRGGAIRTTNTTTIIGSTFHGNFTTSESGGAIDSYTAGSALLTIVNSTITGNSATNAGGGINSSSLQPNIQNSIIAGNIAATGNDVAGGMVSNGANIFGAGTIGSVAGDLVLGSGTELSDIFDQTEEISLNGSASFIAGIAADNDGSGPTVSLKATNGSNPAVDAAGLVSEAILGLDLNGDGDTLDHVDTDGRGHDRTVDHAGVGNDGMTFADIGAYEVQDQMTDGADSLVGGSGDDTINGRAGGDYIEGGGGADVIGAGNGDDRVYAGSGNDVVYLGAGDDYVRVGGGVETFDGGPGNDYISYYDSTGGVTLDMEANTASGSWASNDTVTSFESMSGSKNGDDHVSGTSGANLIRTYGGDDDVYDRGGDDTVELGSGNDYVRVGGGADSLDGGSGSDDYISYYDSIDGVNLDLDSNAVAGGDAFDDTISGFESAGGSNTGDDTIFGTSAENRIKTYGGNDMVHDRGGDDLVELGDGDDVVVAGGGADTYKGGDGNDLINYSASSGGVDLDLENDGATGSWANNDVIEGFESAIGSDTGDDTIRGTSGANTIYGLGGDDRVYALAGNDFVDLGSGDDYLRAGEGQNVYFGGEGTDYISYYDSTGGVNLTLGDGDNSPSGLRGDSFATNDQVYGFEGVSGSKEDADTISGSEGDNIIRTYGGEDGVNDGGGDDSVSLGDGDDTMYAGAGQDTYHGGDGVDVISYYQNAVGVDLDLAANTVSGGDADDDTITGFESVFGSSTGDNTIRGTDGNNTVLTYDGDDRVYDLGGDDLVGLGDGDDYVRAGGGADTYEGGAGDDYISYYDSSGGVDLDFAANTATGSWANNDVVLNFEGGSGSGTGNDTIRGTEGVNVIRTYGGDDDVYDRGGDDVIELGSGDDYLRAGLGGADVYDGGSGSDDYLSYYDSAGGVELDLGVNTASGSSAEGDTISGFESAGGSKTGNDTITGSSGDNRIKTYGGDDRVYDLGGDDLIELGSGDDYVRAGGGADTYDGGSGTDYISYYDSSGGIDVDFAANTATGSWANNDVVLNFEGASGSNTGDDTLQGTDGTNILRGYGGDDRLHGRDGDDSLVGGDGNDSLYGGSGADTMRGGDGADRFDGGGGTGIDLLYGDGGADVFHFDRGEGDDVIKDFENNIDLIEFDNFGYLSDAASALTYATEVSGDVLFDFGADGTLLVENATKAQLLNDIDIV
ncbi:calcium-binding protein [Roseovarius aestuarii]|nr:calcium-binding protein [Roseovarius aestuarii]